MRLEGKRALVTGGGTGIGRGVAIALAREGASVAISYYQSQEGALEAAEEIRALGQQSAAFPADNASVDQCYNLVDRTIETLGGLDIVVNNAGRTYTESFFEIAPETFDLIYHTNLRGLYFISQRAATHMRDHDGGVIINISSVHARLSSPKYSLYDGTKGAIEATTRSLGLELAPLGIRVVGVAPGIIEVPRYYEDRGAYDRDWTAQWVPLGRVGWPDDVGRLCAFLASDDAAFIVGETILCDGGTAARLPIFRKET
jgi:NAD(P)-dependent dehydrogenase (short-subunit alcohol dehydrogenase family)